MINKKNWLLMKKFLGHRRAVDQITVGSAKAEQTHMRYVLEWAGERSFKEVQSIRPTLPEFLQTARLDGREHRLSAIYVRKTLATSRLFFSWLSDNESGYRSISQGWIRTVKARRLADRPRSSEAVSLEEVKAMAASPARTLMERRARAAAIFLYLSGMRIGAFVSLPIGAVDITNRKVVQDPSLGVKTKNRKYGTTYLLDIPELLSAVKEWDEEIRPLLPPNGLWFAPLSPKTGKIDPKIVSVGEHRGRLARRNIR